MPDRIIANSVLSEEFFWTDPRTGETTACWEWCGKTIASRGGKGRAYPVLTMAVPGRGPRNVRVHRLALEVFRGVWLVKRQVAAHLCNYTFCCNPMHLASKTQAENMQQCVAEGRHNSNPFRDFDDLDMAA